MMKPQEVARALGRGSGCIFALVKGCGWDNGFEGLSEFKTQPLSEIRKGKLAFWGFAEPRSQNKTRAPWRSRGWEGRMRHIRGANRVWPCGGVAVDGLGGVVNSIISA